MGTSELLFILCLIKEIILHADRQLKQCTEDEEKQDFEHMESMWLESKTRLEDQKMPVKHLKDPMKFLFIYTHTR